MDVSWKNLFKIMMKFENNNKNFSAASSFLLFEYKEILHVFKRSTNEWDKWDKWEILFCLVHYCQAKVFTKKYFLKNVQEEKRFSI